MNSQLVIQPQSSSDWNPSLYVKFDDERMLAAGDLLARVPLSSAGIVYDLGCGPGNSAELLSRRFPDAEITGIDTSEAMLAHARLRVPWTRFLKQDIADWTLADHPLRVQLPANTFLSTGCGVVGLEHLGTPSFRPELAREGC